MEYKYKEKKSVAKVNMDKQLTTIYKKDVVYLNIIPQEDDYYDIIYVVREAPKNAAPTTAKKK